MKKMLMLIVFGLFATNVNSQEIKTDSITRANDSIKKIEFEKIEKAKLEALKNQEKAEKEAEKEAKKAEKQAKEQQKDLDLLF